MEDASPRLALVTAGGGPVARAAAMELLQRGWSIALQGADEQSAAEAAAGLEQAARPDHVPGRVAPIGADLAVPHQREHLVEQVLEDFERIDMLVNVTIGGLVPPAGDILEMTEEGFAATWSAGLTGPLFLTQLVANEMVRLVEAGLIENPKIVTVNSLSAYTSSVDHGPACITRAALGMVTQLFADRLGQHGINVYEIRAGILATARADAAHAKYDSLIAQGLTPLRRWGRPQDVARAVAAIAENLLDFSTGEVINVDGGFHLRRL